MTVIKEAYVIPVTIIDINVKMLLSKGENEAALIYILLQTNSEMVSEDNPALEILEKYQLYKTKKVYNNLVGDTGEKIDFLAQLKEQQKFKKDTMIASGKINSDTLIAIFENGYMDKNGYPYKGSLTSKEKGMFKYLIATYGEERAKHIVEKGFQYWELKSKHPITVEGLVSIASSIPYYATGVGSWD